VNSGNCTKTTFIAQVLLNTLFNILNKVLGLDDSL